MKTKNINYIDLKTFAASLDGRQYGYPQFTDKEIQTARDNDFVIVCGASDDLVEMYGAVDDEGGCYDGGTIYVDMKVDAAGRPMTRIVDLSDFTKGFIFEAKWCKETNQGKTIPWTYDVPVKHETFMIYEDSVPYCRGFVFDLKDIYPCA